MVEHNSEKIGGGGSIPLRGTFLAGVVQPVERFLAKEKVTGAHPVTRSSDSAEWKMRFISSPTRAKAKG